MALNRTRRIITCLLYHERFPLPEERGPCLVQAYPYLAHPSHRAPLVHASSHQAPLVHPPHPDHLVQTDHLAQLTHSTYLHHHQSCQPQLHLINQISPAKRRLYRKRGIRAQVPLTNRATMTRLIRL